jgi:predicted ATPase
LTLDPRVLRGWALLVPDGIAAAVAPDKTHGATYGSYSLTLFAEVLAHSGDHDGALAALADADAVAEESGERWWKAELHRLTGTVLVARNKLDEGESSLQEAIRVAQAQQAKSLELRAARDLARLWGEQGRRAEARDLLAPVYGWFTEGFDTLDLKEAKALLDTLTS